MTQQDNPDRVNRPGLVFALSILNINTKWIVEGTGGKYPFVDLWLETLIAAEVLAAEMKGTSLVVAKFSMALSKNYCSERSVSRAIQRMVDDCFLEYHSEDHTGRIVQSTPLLRQMFNELAVLSDQARVEAETEVDQHL